MKILRLALLGPVLFVLTLWACAAIWIDGPASRPLAGGLAVAFALAAGALVLLRPRRGLPAFLLLFALLAGWWLSISPSYEGVW